jgi:hypothetical protein
MTREKTTISLDRSKAGEARSLVGAGSLSEVVDMALDHLIRVENRRADIVAYRREPPNEAAVELGFRADASDLAGDTDWEALYGDQPS